MRDREAGVLLRRAVVLGDGALASAMANDLAGTRDLVVERVLEADRQHGDALGAVLSECDVVLSAVAPADAAPTLRAIIEAKRPVADVAARVEDALGLHQLALERHVAACVGCGDGLLRLLGTPGAAADVRVAALLTTALARRLLTGDFRDHWGIWTPQRLVARVGMAHGILQDLRDRGIDVELAGGGRA